MIKYVKPLIQSITPSASGDIFKTNQYLLKQIADLKENDEQLQRICREEDMHDPTDELWSLYRTMMTNAFKANRVI